MTVTLLDLAGTPGLPPLVVGPSLGTSAETLWAACADELTHDFHVIGWDLPGHGRNRTVPATTSVAELADGLVEALEAAGIERFAYAGDSVGGAVGLQLLLDVPDRVDAATLLCTGAQIGTAEIWDDRIATVQASGTPSIVMASAQRWFGPGYVAAEPERASALLHALSGVDDRGYVAVCEAIAAFDVRDRLAEIGTPVLAVAGTHDIATPPDKLLEIAEGVRHGRLVVLEGVAHLAPAERPAEVAVLIRDHSHPTTEESR